MSYLNGLLDCDKIIYTPTSRKNLEKAYPPDSPFWEKATTILHIFFENVKTKNIIGVTGSKGKGTTSTLIAKMLEAEGKKVHLGGNIGRPVLDFISEVGADDWVVLELANFQLYKFPYSPHIAVVLMVAEEHMDWQADMADYLEAKSNITRHQSKDDIVIYLAGNDYSEQIAGYSPGTKLPYGTEPGAFVRGDGMVVMGKDEIEIINKSEVKLIGKHNLQNICAACTTVYEAVGSLDKAKVVLFSFSGLEHRLEFVREFEGIKYYDDSFGTTPDTAIVAIQAFVQPVVLIAGGSDKGIPFDRMVEEIAQKDRVRHVIAIGQTGPPIAKMLQAKGFNSITEGLTTMPEIVATARKSAQPGDVVLLSTGCASFGLFHDYKDRGNQFKQAVLKLA